MCKKKHLLLRLLFLTLFSYSQSFAQDTIPVQMHIARTTDGSNPRASTNDVNTEIDALNSAFNSLGVTFVLCGTDYVDEDRLRDQFDDDDQAEKNWLDNFTKNNSLNYFITDLKSGSHGRAAFPNKQKDWVLIDYKELGTSTIVHETGHYLNLQHTYSGIDADDPTDSNSLTIADGEGVNGWKYGDYLTDTPLDPENRSDFNSSCQYTGNQLDANGDSFHPDGTNFMGKGHSYCRSSFSNGQKARMLRSITIDRYYLDCSNTGNTNLTCANSQSVTSFPHNDSFEGDYSNSPWVQARYGDDLNWKIAPNTPSSSTGPKDAQNGQTFMHAEANFTYSNSDELILLSPCYDFSNATAAQVDFFYHMYGSGTGTLRLEISDDNGANWTSIFSRSGEQHNSSTSSWTQENIDLTNYVGTNIQLRFKAILGSSSKSDISIDNVTVNASLPSVYFSDASIKKRDLLGKVKIYPNPIKDEFYIKGLQKKPTLVIHDINGRLILKRNKYKGDKVDTSGLSSGVYFIKTSNNGQEIIKKLLKK